MFAAAAGEILPDVIHGGSPGATVIGGSIGVATMLAVKRLEAYIKGPADLLTTVGVDILIDGLVLGIGVAAGTRAGILLTIALTLEVLFLGLTLTNELIEGGRSRSAAIGVTTAIMFLLPIGTLLANTVAVLPGTALTAFFAFGLIALLYLVTEELLVEAHEAPDCP